MKPKVPNAGDNASRLRRRNRGHGRNELIRSNGLIILVFLALILWFTPPFPKQQFEVDSSPNVEDRLDGFTPVIVECTLSTPHSQHPASEVANGKFQIAILTEDANRKGSSASAFLKLVENHFYDGVYTFRVIKGFIVQWGIRSDMDETIASTPAEERIAESDVAKKAVDLEDSPLDSTETEANRMNLLMRKENRRGTVTMIAGDTGQVFINIGDNRRLDNDGTIPFGVILESSEEENDERRSQTYGIRLIDRIFNGYKGGMGQVPAIHKKEVSTKFPEMSRIDSCSRIV